MTRQKLFVIASIITCYLLQAQGADKYTDENRPYEFGFTIDGQQHRHEEKDKNGIIKGEYGFITADGVYHVTVYATDEQGRFKILSMKNIRYRDYKGRPPSAPRQGHSLQLPSPQPATSQKPTSLLAPAPKPALEFETISIEPPANSCSHCSIPTTSTAAPRPIPPINQLNYANSAPNTPGQSNPFYSSNTPNTPPSFNSFLQAPNPVQKTSGLSQNQNSYNENQGFGVAQEQQNYNAAQSGPQGPISSGNPLGYGGVPSTAQGPKASGQQITPGSEIVSNGQQVAPVGQQLSPGGQQYAPVGQQLSPGGQQFAPGGQQIAPVGQQLSPGGQQFTPSAQQVTSGRPQNTPGGQQYPRGGDNFERTRSGKQYTGSPNLSTPQNSVPGGPSISQANLKPNQKPMLAYAQMQIVDKNTDIHAKRQGEKDGLPPGLKEDDMLKLLYTFNYTLGFQAHFEEGYTNGEKRGYYYTTGRNGVRTRIDYVADENGFRPTLSQEVYDTLSDEVPKEETEKEDKYGLKGYEFKWLYFPPGTNSQ